MKNFKEMFDKEIMPGLGELKKVTPEQMETFHKFMESSGEDGEISKKYKELMALSIAVAVHCSYCISFHIKGAIDAGATKEEILESGWVAVLMGGGPALMYFLEVQKAIKDFKKGDKK